MFISLNSIRVAGAHLYRASVVTFSLSVCVCVNSFKQHCNGCHSKKGKGIKAMLLKQAIKGFEAFKRLYRPRNLNKIKKKTAAIWIVLCKYENDFESELRIHWQMVDAQLDNLYHYRQMLQRNVINLRRDTRARKRERIAEKLCSLSVILLTRP